MQKVKIYGRKGEVETHTKPNARDLVANCDGYWSWNPQRDETGPMAKPSFRTMTPPSNKPQTHEILERMGTGAVRDVEDIKPTVPDTDEEEGESGTVTVEDNAAPASVEEAVADVIPEPIAEHPVEKPARARRKRFEE